jgi:large subunit ribosomal protein LX
MKTKIFRVTGQFMMGDNYQPFTKELKAIKEEDIYEKIYSEFGSKHHLTRNQINIENIDEITAEEVEDPIIKAMV